MLLTSRSAQCTGFQLYPEDINFVTSLSYNFLSGFDLSVWNKLCEFATNKICYSMKWEMASDEKYIVTISLLKIFVLSTKESTPPTSANAF